MTLLHVRDLNIHIDDCHLVRNVDLDIAEGECLALVGESGSGKSLTALSLMGLLPRGGKSSWSNWQFRGQVLVEMREQDWRRLRSKEIAMIFQNPQTALNPTARLGRQIAETLELHSGFSRRAAEREAVALLERMGIVDASKRARQYPFELSGGMLQRAVIAMAVACKPSLLIADEPTTALDASVQAEVLALLEELCREQGMGMLLITHDLSVVESMADRVAVMYAGSIMEQGDKARVLSAPAHPYTKALERAIPRIGEHQSSLLAIEGTPPDMTKPLPACSFAPRCGEAMNICVRSEPPIVGVADHQTCRCWLPECPR